MNLAYTVWKDGTHKLWSLHDAHHVEQDPDWLCTLLIPPAAEVAAQLVENFPNGDQEKAG